MYKEVCSAGFLFLQSAVPWNRFLFQCTSGILLHWLINSSLGLKTSMIIPLKLWIIAQLSSGCPVPLLFTRGQTGRSVVLQYFCRNRIAAAFILNPQACHWMPLDSGRYLDEIRMLYILLQHACSVYRYMFPTENIYNEINRVLLVLHKYKVQSPLHICDLHPSCASL